MCDSSLLKLLLILFTCSEFSALLLIHIIRHLSSQLTGPLILFFLCIPFFLFQYQLVDPTPHLLSGNRVENKYYQFLVQRFVHEDFIIFIPTTPSNTTFLYLPVLSLLLPSFSIYLFPPSFFQSLHFYSNSTTLIHCDGYLVIMFYLVLLSFFSSSFLSALFLSLFSFPIFFLLRPSSLSFCTSFLSILFLPSTQRHNFLHFFLFHFHCCESNEKEK